MEKKLKTDIEAMVMGAHYLEALDMESRASESLSDMERQDFLFQIASLNRTITALHETIELMKKQHEDDRISLIKLQDTIDKNAALISELRNELRNKEERLNRNNSETYGSKTHKGKPAKGKGSSSPSREEEKDRYDGNPQNASSVDSGKLSPSTDSASESDSDAPVAVAGHHSGPRESKYSLMDADEVVFLKCLRECIPDGWSVVGEKTFDEYHRESRVVCTRFQILILEDQYGKRHDFYMPVKAGDDRVPYGNVVTGTHGTPEYIAGLATDRYQMHLPIRRQMIRIANEKMSMCEQTVTNWLERGAELLQNLLPSLKKLLLKAKSILHIDETWCRVKIKSKNIPNGKYFKKYVWVLVNKMAGIVYFLYDNDENDSRGTRPISSFLDGFKGGIQTDAYVVYKFFTDQSADNDHALCWAHVRSKFFQAAKYGNDENAEWFVRRIGELYAIELKCRENHMDAEQIKARRNAADVNEILSEIYQRAISLQNNPNLHYGNLMNTALNYMVNNWKKLQNYRNDGRYDIDNLEAERQIRPFTVGRSNSKCFGAESGVKRACIYYTIISTLKECKLSVLDTLTYLIRELDNGNKDYDGLVSRIFIPQTI